MKCRSSEHAKRQAKRNAEGSGVAWRYFGNQVTGWHAERAPVGDDPVVSKRLRSWYEAAEAELLD